MSIKTDFLSPAWFTGVLIMSSLCLGTFMHFREGRKRKRNSEYFAWKLLLEICAYQLCSNKTL